MRRERTAAREHDARTLERVADERDTERISQQRRHVARAGHVAALVESVGILEVRVSQAELCGFRVHEIDEAIGRSAADVKRECFRGVVRARDERRPQEVRDRQLLARAQVDRRLAHVRRQWADPDDVVQPCVLQHDDGRHELRDARDRVGAGGVAAREDGAVLAHEVPRGGRDLRRSGSIGARSLNGGREDGDESDDGEQCSAHQRRRL